MQVLPEVCLVLRNKLLDFGYDPDYDPDPDYDLDLIQISQIFMIFLSEVCLAKDQSIKLWLWSGLRSGSGLRLLILMGGLQSLTDYIAVLSDCIDFTLKIIAS